MFTSHKTMYIPFVYNQLFREIKIKCVQSFQMSRPNSLNFSMHIIFPRLTLKKARAVTNMMCIVNVETVSFDIWKKVHI